MKPHELEHALRAAGRILDEKRFYVVGSQSILGAFPDAPEGLTRSNEVDLIAKTKGKDTSALEVIAELSPFHETFGYYVDPVDKDTVTLPKKWESRLVNFNGHDTEGVIGLCLDPHDLFISKVAAGREKDIEYVKIMIEHQMVSMEKIMTLADTIPVPEHDITRKERLLTKIQQLYAGFDPSKAQHINEQSGRYTGKILSKADAACQQEVGKGRLVFHDLDKLDKPISVGRVYTIEYKDGKGTVSDKLIDKGHGRSR